MSQISLTQQEFNKKLAAFASLVDFDNRPSYEPFILTSDDGIFHYKNDLHNISLFEIRDINIAEDILITIQAGTYPEFSGLGNPNVRLKNIHTKNNFVYKGVMGSLEIIDCKLKATVNINGNLAQSLTIKSAQLGDTEIGSVGTGKLTITNTTVEKIEFLGKFQPSKIFVQKLNVNSNAYHTFHELRVAAENSKDKIQSVYLFNQELKNYISKNKRTNELVIFFLNWVSNNHGRSFLMPLLWALATNFLLITLIVGYTDLYTVLNINPLTVYVDENVTNSLKALDGLRRMLMTVFIYQMLVSLRQFHYKYQNS